jgi:hypothetical protein
VTTLNRFPLLGLWAKEVARRLGYTVAEAKSLGHGYAVLYAIRAARPAKKEHAETKEPRRQAQREPEETLSIAGDELPIEHDEHGKVRARVGGEKPQTSHSYDASIEAKFPDGYYEKLEDAFRERLKSFKPGELDSRLTYELYDEWKKACGVCRRVDLHKLLSWGRKQYGNR